MKVGGTTDNNPPFSGGFRGQRAQRPGGRQKRGFYRPAGVLFRSAPTTRAVGYSLALPGRADGALPLVGLSRRLTAPARGCWEQGCSCPRWRWPRRSKRAKLTTPGTPRSQPCPAPLWSSRRPSPVRAPARRDQGRHRSPRTTPRRDDRHAGGNGLAGLCRLQPVDRGKCGVAQWSVESPSAAIASPSPGGEGRDTLPLN